MKSYARTFVFGMNAQPQLGQIPCESSDVLNELGMASTIYPISASVLYPLEPHSCISLGD